MSPRVGGLMATWLLTRLMLSRMKNLALSGFQVRRRLAAVRSSSLRAQGGVEGEALAREGGGYGGPRTATRSKSGTSWMLLSLCLCLWVPGIIAVMFDVVDNLRAGVASRPLEVEVPAGLRTRLPLEPGMTEATPLINALAFTLLCALLMALHGLLMAPDLWRVEWSFEWLFTLPLSVPSLLFVRTVAGTLTNLAGAFLVAPLLGAIAWNAGYRWSAPVLALALSMPLLALAALARQVFEIALRLALDPARLRNIQALATVGGFALWIPAMFVLSPAAQDAEHAVFRALSEVPAVARWLPPGLAVCALTSTDPRAALGYAAGLVLEVGALMTLAFAYLGRRLRCGLISGGGRESARLARGELARPRPRRWLTPFQAKTLLLLARDRNMAVTVFGLPAFVIAQQYVMFNDLSVLSTLDRVAAAAFCVGAMALAVALPQVLLKETETFWFLKTFPRAIEGLLLENALLWGGMLSIYPVIGLALSTRLVSATPPAWLAMGLLVVLGMAAYTIIATGLALLSSNPTATDDRKQLSPWGMWLYMVLVGVYLQALVSGDAWRMVGGLTLALMLAYAFWQKVCDQLPYMLDPAAEPPPRISLSDGLIAAEVFFVLQAVALSGLRITAPTLRQVMPSFTLAGGVTCALVLLTVWQLKMSGLPRLTGAGGLRAAGEGVVGGAAAGAFGLGFMYLLRHSERFAHLVPREPPVPADELLLLAVLGMVAAPFFEEMIFRGLVYSGLRRSLPRASAVLAASLLFAVLHPPHAFVPVFVMALAATLLFERHGLLVTSILVHAVYNACVLFVRF